MQHINSITEEIFEYGKKKHWYVFAGSTILFSLIFILLWISIALADAVFYFSEITRWGLLLINLPILFWLCFRLIVKPFNNWIIFKKSNDLSEIAHEIGISTPEIEDRLVNIYQLSKQKSSPLQKAAVEQLSKTFWQTRFSARIEKKRYFPGIKLYLPVILSVTVVVFFQPEQILRSTLRLLNPSNNYVVIPPYTFDVIPGSKNLLYGEPFEIVANYNGPDISEMRLLYKQADKDEIRSLNMEKRKDTYYTRFKEVTGSFSYQLLADLPYSNDLDGKIVSDTFNVKVFVPPFIQEINIKITSPQYSGGESQKNELNNANIAALNGSNVFLDLVSNKALKNASVVFSNGDTLVLDTKGKIAKGQFVVKDIGNYKVRLTDIENLRNQDPIVYSISILPDNAPFVDITEPGTDIEAQLDDRMTVKIDAVDDYGLSNIYLMYRYVKKSQSSDSSWHKMSIDQFQRGTKKAELYQRIDFSDFFVGYNDQIEYYAVALDNNSVGGYSKSESPIYKIIFPSMDELFNEFTGKENEKIDDLERLADESQELKQKLEEINRDLKRTEKLDWETKKQLENTLKKQQDAQEKIEKIQQELEEMIDKLDQNDLMNPEILEKYNQLQELFKEIATPELLDSMKKLQQAMENANPNEVQKALENFKLNQESFQQNLERTLELFKQVQLEQQLDQMIQQAEKLSKNQEKISDEIENKPSDQKAENALQNDQKLQEELLSSLERNLENLLQQEKLNDFSNAREQLSQTKEDIEQQKLSEQLQELSKQLQQQNFSEASANSQKMEQSFQGLQQNLNMAMKNLQQQHKQNVQKKMMAATQKMLQLSHQQEKIEQKTRDASQINDDIREMARQQSSLQNNLGKLLSDLIKLSKETFFINPDMNKNMANAYSSMQRSLDNLSERRSSQAAADQQLAMEALNRGVNSLQNSMSQLSAAQSGTGFEQFMQQLQQMAGAQGGLNDETMNFLQGQGNNGQMSSQQQAQRRRMAAEQKAIQQALTDMADNMGNRGDVLGRLNEMGEQMDEIIHDMLADNINRTTIQRQQQILSRMLDAQKSVREREFSKKRKAEQAKQYSAKDPGELKEYEVARQKELQEALQKALSEGYYDDYQKLIKAYFKQLSSEKQILPEKE
ncbi:MAG: hypothetical protein H6627_06185 [Calditrichae bacterium]|nr:hypothetical protein [Calditrichia bacterium]